MTLDTQMVEYIEIEQRSFASLYNSHLALLPSQNSHHSPNHNSSLPLPTTNALLAPP